MSPDNDDRLEPTIAQPAINFFFYCGVFLLALAAISFQIVLTRIFSVTMYHHFAFVAISLTMFGMSAGAVAVYLLPQVFCSSALGTRLCQASACFALSIAISLVLHLVIPLYPAPTAVSLFAYFATYTALSVPFFFAGIAICLVLTKFTHTVNCVYATDLCGAASGCLFAVAIMNGFDGLSAALCTASAAALAGCFFAAEFRLLDLRRQTMMLFALLFAAAISNGLLSRAGIPLVRLSWVKGEWEELPAYERWNSFSRVAVGAKSDEQFGWGFGAQCPRSASTTQRSLEIDAAGATVLTEFDGNLSPLEYLRCDITNFVHFLRKNADTAVVGSGGGRDILSALLFAQRAVLGIEINENVLDALNNQFGDFTGHLDAQPQINFINDEARSYLARSSRRFDIIQISLIDTWAATAAGALTLSENSLYTLEAWQMMLSKLTANGILSISRWFAPERPAELLRSAALAAAALRANGVSSPQDHILALTNIPLDHQGSENGIGTLLISHSPFSTADLQQAAEIAAQMGFFFLSRPGSTTNPLLEALIAGNFKDPLVHGSIYDLSPPTDDRPFFFNTLRLRSLTFWRPTAIRAVSHNAKAIGILLFLFAVVIILSYFVIVRPLKHTLATLSGPAVWPLSAAFGFIGLGYLLIEIAQMQRLIIFLGHPVYGLTAVLFALLLTGGIGSFLTRWCSICGKERKQLLWLFCTLIFVLGLSGVLTPAIIAKYRGCSTPVRLLVSVLSVAPIGLLMGMPFPWLMQSIRAKENSLRPWLWGVNGAASVSASILAALISLCAGISASYWIGVICYAGAALSAWQHTMLARDSVH
ncbi:MAG TPA: hypothetical protein PLP17_02605 [Oligoflexia bacterium]|nr:hypothetical protein [Oligoflexia bacterium]